MATEYQTFRGASMTEALAHVRDSLGADALIASTRQIDSDEEFGSMFEVVAAPPSQRAERVTVAPRARSMPPKLTRPSFVRSPEASEVGRELVQLRVMLEELCRGRSARSDALAALYDAGFEASVARSLAHGASHLEADVVLRDWLGQRIAARCNCLPGVIERGRGQVIVCVGTSGAGKTTTLAKLAARASLELRRKVRVVSLDTFRLGAMDQWQRLAELVGFSVDVADNIGKFQRIAHASKQDLLLVDTAGARSEVERTLLEGCLAGVPAAQLHVWMVLPAWLRARDAERLASHSVGPELTGLVITKMDEANEIGGVMHAPITTGLPLTYLCHGARIPEDIRDATAESVVNAIFPEQA